MQIINFYTSVFIYILVVEIWINPILTGRGDLQRIKEIDFILYNNTEPFKIKTRFDCDSNNLIYFLKCQGCDEDSTAETCCVKNTCY